MGSLTKRILIDTEQQGKKAVMLLALLSVWDGINTPSDVACRSYFSLSEQPITICYSSNQLLIGMLECLLAQAVNWHLISLLILGKV